MAAASEMTKAVQGTPEELWARAQGHEQTESDLRADLVALESQAGGVMLDDPESAEALVGRVVSLRARVALEGRAAAEARKRAQAAHVAGLRAEADALEPETARIRGDLAVYQKQRDKLLKALEDFTRAEWVLKPDPDLRTVGRYERRLRPDEVLLSEVRAVEERQTALRSQADAAEADQEWMPPALAEATRLRDAWDRTVERYREWAVQLRDAWKVIDEVAEVQKRTREEVLFGDGGFGQLNDARAAAPRLEQALRGFWDDVAHFRREGMDLSDDEVSALKVELGLEAE